MNLRTIVALAFAATVAFGMAAAATPVLGGPDSDGTAPAAPKTATTATTVVKTAPADPAANTVAAKAWAIVSPPGAASRPVPTWVRPPQPGHAAARRDAPLPPPSRQDAPAPGGRPRQ